MTMQGLTLQPKRCRPSTTWGGNCSLIPLTAQTLPPSDFHLFAPWKEYTRGTKFESNDEAKVLWATSWDISLKIFMVKEYRSLCTDGKNVWNWWETMLEKKNLSFYLNYKSLYGKIHLIYWTTLVATFVCDEVWRRSLVSTQQYTTGSSSLQIPQWKEGQWLTSKALRTVELGWHISKLLYAPIRWCSGPRPSN